MKRVATVLTAMLAMACSDATPVAPDAKLDLSAPDANLVVAGTVLVTNANNAGHGSFRRAVEQANSNPWIRHVVFRPGVGTVYLASGVVFTGSQDLSIDGKRATIDGAGAGGTAFQATGGGDLRVSNIVVRNAPGEGIAVEVPPSATGTIRVSLTNVEIIGNRGHGVLVNDQEDPSTQDDVQPDPAGSAASVEVTAIATRFAGNGFSVSDRDGLRVNEGGAGNLTLTLSMVRSEDNGADGVELDERGEGDVRVNVFGTRFERNGQFDPADLDDGFDIDEADAGSIIGRLVLTAANDNYEEGLDFNENNAGDLRVDLTLVEANGNREEGIDYEEDDDFAGGGDLVSTMVGIKANGNGADGGDAGLKIREKGAGELRTTIVNVETSLNVIGGISIREDAVGNLVSDIRNATSIGNADHGIDFDENRLDGSDAGNLTATVTASSASNNGGAGIRADQQAPGIGSLTLTAVTLNGNTAGPTTGSNVPVTIVP